MRSLNPASWVPHLASTPHVNPLLLLTLVVACLGSFRDSPDAIPAAYAQPQVTISNYWHAMLERRHLSALSCFVAYTPADVGNMLPLPELVELRCRDFQVRDRGRGQVDVTYTVEYRVAMGRPLSRFPSGDRLCLTRGGWKIQRPLLGREAHL